MKTFLEKRRDNMKDLAILLRQLDTQQLLDCCKSLAAVEEQTEGMYRGQTVQWPRAEAGDEQFYQFEALLNAECRRRWYAEHR